MYVCVCGWRQMSGCFIRDSHFTAVKQSKTAAAAAAAAGLIRQPRRETVPLLSSRRLLSDTLHHFCRGCRHKRCSSLYFGPVSNCWSSTSTKCSFFLSGPHLLKINQGCFDNRETALLWFSLGFGVSRFQTASSEDKASRFRQNFSKLLAEQVSGSAWQNGVSSAWNWSKHLLLKSENRAVLIRGFIFRL